MDVSDGDGLRILGKGLRGALPGSFSRDIVGVLPEFSTAAGKSCFGAFGGRELLGPAGKVARVVVNDCKCLDEDRS